MKAKGGLEHRRGQCKVFIKVIATRGLFEKSWDAREQTDQTPSVQFISRLLLGLLFIVAGLNHFRSTPLYVSITPPALPFPIALVYLSGLAEIAGGTGVWIPKTRRAAGWGLLALLLAVFPANIYMATANVVPPGTNIPSWILWARLPLQFVLMAWVWAATLRHAS